jgi:hypothetical protein
MQKLPVEKLRERGAIDTYDRVLIDTGAVWFGSDILETLKDIETSVRHFLYVDWLYPMTTAASEETYLLDPPDGEPSVEHEELRVYYGNNCVLGNYGCRPWHPPSFYMSVPPVSTLDYLPVA